MNEFFAQTLAGVLEETATNLGNAMVLNHLATKGSITLEEATFFHNLVTEVITEAAEDFIPDSIEIDDTAPAAPVELFDSVGNKYLFQDGQLVPADGTATADVDGDVDGDGDGMAMPTDGTPAVGTPAPDATASVEAGQEEGEANATSDVDGLPGDPDPVQDEDENSDPATYTESTDLVDDNQDGEVIEESTLPDSNAVVARILANLANR